MWLLRQHRSHRYNRNFIHPLWLSRYQLLVLCIETSTASVCVVPSSNPVLTEKISRSLLSTSLISNATAAIHDSGVVGDLLACHTRERTLHRDRLESITTFHSVVFKAIEVRLHLDNCVSVSASAHDGGLISRESCPSDLQSVCRSVEACGFLFLSSDLRQSLCMDSSDAIYRILCRGRQSWTWPAESLLVMLALFLDLFTVRSHRQRAPCRIYPAIVWIHNLKNESFSDYYARQC